MTAIDRPWVGLANACYIDAVLADVNTRPEVWDAARDAAWKEVVESEAWHAAGYAAGDAAQGTARSEAWHAALGAARSAARGAARSAAGYAAWSAAWWPVTALIAWDSSADLLDLSADALRTLIDLAPAPVCHQAVLLLPWALVREAGK